MNDLVKRLRGLRCFGPEHFSMLYEAANAIEMLQKDLDDRLSNGMALTLKATIHDLQEQLAAVTAQRDELNELCTYHENNGIEMAEQLAAVTIERDEARRTVQMAYEEVSLWKRYSQELRL